MKARTVRLAHSLSVSNSSPINHGWLMRREPKGGLVASPALPAPLSQLKVLRSQLRTTSQHLSVAGQSRASIPQSSNGPWLSPRESGSVFDARELVRPNGLFSAAA
jgi:hypothetical protein